MAASHKTPVLERFMMDSFDSYFPLSPPSLSPPVPPLPFLPSSPASSLPDRPGAELQSVPLLARSPSTNRKYPPLSIDKLEEEINRRMADDNKLFREEFNVRHTRTPSLWSHSDFRIHLQHIFLSPGTTPSCDTCPGRTFIWVHGKTMELTLFDVLEIEI